MTENAHPPTQPDPLQSRPAGSPGLFRRFVRAMVMYILPLAFIAGGVKTAIWLIESSPKARQQEPKITRTLVEVQTLEPTSTRAVLEAMGTVTAAREVVLQPQVTGKIVEVAPGFIPGGRYAADELMVQIERRDYELALQQQRSQVLQVQADLKMEEGQQEIAKREWELLDAGKDASKLDLELALRKPQLAKLNATLSSVRAAEEQSETDLSRTSIRAPFNGMITDRLVELGTQVTPQSQLANFVGTDTYWVQVAVPVDRLSWLDIPVETGQKGSPARIYQKAGSQTIAERTGHIIRLLGDVVPEGRMARVLVEIDDPLGLADGEPDAIPLLLGSYVQVVLEGNPLENVFAVPRTALRDGDRVWLMDDKATLEVRDTDVVWRSAKKVFVRDSLKAGEQLVVSNIPTPIPGMKLRTEVMSDEDFEENADPSLAEVPTDNIQRGNQP